MFMQVFTQLPRCFLFDGDVVANTIRDCNSNTSDHIAGYGSEGVNMLEANSWASSHVLSELFQRNLAAQTGNHFHLVGR